MSDNSKKIPRFINDIRDTFSFIISNTKSHSCKEAIILLNNDGVFEKLLAGYLYDPKLVRTDEDIHDAVKLWCDDYDTAIDIYGHINEWDVSNVTNMNGLFKGHYFIGYFDEYEGSWGLSNRASAMKFKDTLYKIFKGDIIIRETPQKPNGVKEQIIDDLCNEREHSIEEYEDIMNSIKNINLNKLYKE